MGELIHVVMAVYEPAPEFLRDQLVSISAQTHRPLKLWVVEADCRSAEVIRTTVEAAGFGAQARLDWALVTPPQPLGAVQAFETGLDRALAAAGPDDLFALSDQDDVWHPQKLAKSLSALRARGADLVHGDARIVDEAGHLRHPSMFRLERRIRRPGMRGLLYLNTVTGMTTLMTRRVVAAALPFPPQSGVHFYHDLWLALVAELFSDTHAMRGALVDYRQHAQNAVGAIETKLRQPRMLSRPWLRDKLARYSLAHYLARSLYIRAQEVIEADISDVPRPRLEPLRPFLTPHALGLKFTLDGLGLLLRGHFQQARLALGHGLVGVGRFVWALRPALLEDMPHRMAQFTHRGYGMSPGLAPPDVGGTREGPAPTRGADWQDKTDIRTQLRFTPDLVAESPAVVLMVPTLNPAEVFAGIATAVDIGLGLAARGVNVRFVATDLPIASAQASREFLTRRLSRARVDAGTDPRDGTISLLCGVTSDSLELHRDDIFLATAWWTAHLADTLLRRHPFRASRFLYLIQDFEPNFYPWGSEFSEAMASYDFAFEPIFNTTLLREYFAEQGFGFATPDALTFRPSIDVSAYADLPRGTAEGPRRLAVYGRPEVPRNMFPIALGALAQFIEARGLGPEDIVLDSVGLAHEPVNLPNGLVLRSKGKLPWEHYPGYLASVDVGLALMYSPHPSHLPIEMAAAGAQVVTNGFATKDLSQLSPLIRSTQATAPALAAALDQAWEAAPADMAARHIDLAPLGLPLNEVIEKLSVISPHGPHLREGGK